MPNSTHADVYLAAALSRLGVSAEYVPPTEFNAFRPAPAPIEAEAPVEIQPHPFEEDPASPGFCVCGLPLEDPAHSVEFAAAPAEDTQHTFEDDGSGLCVVCGLPAEDPSHVLEPPAGVMNYSAIPHGWDDPENGTALCLVCGGEVLSAIHDNQLPITAGAEGEKGARFRIPVLIPGGGAKTGDGRSFSIGALSVRDMPISLKWQIMSSQGHDQSVVVGRIDHVEMLEDGGIGEVTGVFDTGKYALECVRQIRAGMLRGVSADLDNFDASVLSNPDPDRITAQEIEVNQARLSAATIVQISAFSEAYIELLDEDPAMPDGEYIEETEETLAASAVSSAIPVNPPAEWFENPKLSKPTHLTITDDGRVFGHIAAWSTHHIGLPYGTRPPRSASNYAYFRTGSLRTAEGTDVRVGQISLAGGHAALSADARAAVEHYDNTNSAMCDLAAGEDSHGIWVSGALRPGVSPEKLRAFRASSPSGDWRPINGKLELVAVCSVNVPGFPVAQARVASGAVVALVAAGMVLREAPAAPSVDERALVNSVLAQIELENKAKAAAARFAPAREAKQSALTAAAQTATERIAARKAELSSQAEEIVARVASLRYTPPFEEAKHPRDEEGKFRRVLARLQKALDAKDSAPTPGESKAVSSLERAAQAEESGDNKTAAAEADKAAEAAPEIAGDVKEAKARLDVKGVGADAKGGVPFKQQPAEIQAIIEKIALSEDDVRAKKYIKGGPLSVQEIADIIEHYLERLLLPRVH